MKFSVLGPEGTFTDAAAKLYLQNHQKLNAVIDYQSSFNRVYEALKEEEIGLLPIENQLDGYVMPTLQRLMSSPVNIIDEITIPVNFGLVANVSDIKSIKRIFVQFKTEGQCQKLLNKISSAEIINTSSNIISLQKFQNGTAGDAAIIPQMEMAKLHYPVMENNVADQANNYTRFIIFKVKSASNKQLETKELGTFRFKSSLFVTPSVNDQPGTLYNILGFFAKAQLNLVTLMSLPTKDTLGVYSFYIELSGTTSQKEVLFKTITQLENQYHVKLLGYYSA